MNKNSNRKLVSFILVFFLLNISFHRRCTGKTWKDRSIYMRTQLVLEFLTQPIDFCNFSNSAEKSIASAAVWSSFIEKRNSVLVCIHQLKHDNNVTHCKGLIWSIARFYLVTFMYPWSITLWSNIKFFFLSV